MSIKCIGRLKYETLSTNYAPYCLAICTEDDIRLWRIYNNPRGFLDTGVKNFIY